MFEKQRYAHSALIALTSLICVFCCGCLVVPVKVATKTRTPSGLEKKEIADPSFIRVGATKREEVLEKLGWIDVGVNDERFFIGHWTDSSWWVYWMAAAYYTGGGGEGRMWHAHNLLVEFGDKGVVQSVSSFPNKNAVTILSSLLSRYPAPPLNLSTPIEVSVEHLRDVRCSRGKLILRSDSLEFVEDPKLGSKGKHDFSTPSENVTRITTNTHVNTERPELIPETVHFKHKTKIGKEMVIFTDPLGTLTLLKFLAHRS